LFSNIRTQAKRQKLYIFLLWLCVPSFYWSPNCSFIFMSPRR